MRVSEINPATPEDRKNYQLIVGLIWSDVGGSNLMCVRGVEVPIIVSKEGL